MKRKILFRFAMVAIMILQTNVMLAQSHVTIYGNTNMVSNDNKFWALKVNDKVVTDYNYLHFASTDGVYFAVEDKNGKWGVCNNTGTFLFQCQFAKVSVSGATATLYENANDTPKFYDCKTKTYVQAKRVDDNFFADEYKFKEKKARWDHTVEKSKELSASLSPEFRFEVRNNDDYTRQEIIVDGKVRSSWDEIYGIESRAAQDGKTGWWLFRVKENGKMGAYLIQVYENDGKLVTFRGLTIPCIYKSITTVHGRSDLLDCKDEGDSWNSTGAYFDWIGRERNNRYLSDHEETGREWVRVDRETDQWELQTVKK